MWFSVVSMVAFQIAKLYIDGELMPKVDVIARASNYRCAERDFALIPSLAFSRYRDAKWLRGTLRMDGLNSDGIFAIGGSSSRTRLSTARQ